MQEIEEFLVDDALILIPVLFIIGAILKDTPNITKWFIPYIIITLGIILSCFLIGFTIDGVIQGILVSGATVLTHELIKQGSKEKKGGL